MKTAKTFSLLFMFISIAYSLPAENGENSEQNMDDAIENALMMGMSDEANGNLDDAGKEDIADPAGSEKEGKDDLGEEKYDSMLHTVESQKNPNNKGVIKSGDSIALQTFDRIHWASCAGNICNRQSCPKMQMNGDDWTRCSGVVFQIYRRRGPGVVKVGDTVGLYFPAKPGYWLGCAGSKCGKAPCPGNPTLRHGFSNAGRWGPCWGEVYRIYAKGKHNGAPINADDDVSFYYPKARLWVALGRGEIIRLPCLGRSFPPPLAKYDSCAYETFTIWKKTC